MKSKANVLAGLSLLLTLSLCSQAQNFNRTISANDVHHNSISDAWNFSVNSGAAFGMKSNESSLFRGNSIATKLSGRYYFGNFGLGISVGIIPGAISNDAVNKFFIDRKFPSDATVTKTKPGNSYLLFGPSFRFGKRIRFGAELSGGLFYNDAGGLSVNQQGVSRPLYRFDNGNNNLFPGFSGNLHIAYPINSSTRFLINTDYLQTKSSIRILDPQQGIDIATLQNRSVKLFTVGVGIVKSFNTSNETSRKHPGVVKYDNIVLREIVAEETNLNEPTTRRVLPTVNKREIFVDESGVQTQRVLPTVNKKDIAIDEPGTLRTISANDVHHNSITESCGPVTQKTTNPDGTVSEMTFSCPEDAAKYSRINSINSMPSRLSMTPTTTRQTQGQTFGEKVSSGLQSGAGALTQGASARNILIGKVSRVAGNVAGIETNETVSSAESKRPGRTKYNNITLKMYSREKGSGLATGRRQYQLIYSDDADSNCTDCDATVVENPLYESRGTSGSNPLFEGKDKRTTGTDDDCDGIAGLNVYLMDAESDVVLASTKTEACGEFFFANLPSGPYTVKVEGRFISKKGYDVYLKNKEDVAGQLLSGNDNWTIELSTGTGTAEQAAAIIKTKTKSNQSNDRTSNSGLVWSPKSNYLKVLPMTVGDLDGDGIPEIAVGSNGSPMPALMPGGPIKGVLVKGGRNPGGNIVAQGRTNANGNFEFTNLKAGNYTITVEQNKVLSDESILEVGETTNGDLDGDGRTERKGWDGVVKGSGKIDETDTPSQKEKVVEKATSGLKDNIKTNVRTTANNGLIKGNEKLDAQDYNSTRSNKLLIDTKPGNDTENNGKVIVRGWDPLKKEGIQRNINTSESDLKSLSAELDKLEQQMKRARRNTWGSGGGTSGKVENLRTAIAIVLQTLNTLQQKDKDVALNELDQKTSEMDKQFAELQNSLSGLGNEYSSISNTLKAKHDTVKNSINNVR